MAHAAGSPEPEVILVGRKLPDNENLGLGYLLASLRGHGRPASMLALNTWMDMERICRRVAASRPFIVGLSLPDGGSAFLPLGLGELLRRRGYGGHITAGGGFATLARKWLLDRYGWLDSVVRFAGETAIVGLAAALDGGGRVEEVPGLTTRRGDGRPADVMDETPLRLFPDHRDPPEILGRPMVHVSATRGCPGRCAYCGPAALQGLERREGERGGVPREELIRCGVGGTRRRSLESLCDEMALLWHRDGVRYFYFVDEHLLPRREEEALAYLRGWKKGLGKRGVKELGLGIMLRADFLTPSIARAFVDVGLVRAFVGLELASRGELARFGRGGSASRGLEVMAGLEDMGVATISNLMLVHPYSTPATIRGGIRLLAHIRRGTFEATKMQVYHGTRLHARLLEEGRLEGNPLRYGYGHEDGTVARFDEIFTRLRGEALGDYSLSYRLHDIRLLLALARRLHPRADLDGIAAGVRAETALFDRLRVDAYGRALEMAEDRRGFADCGDLVKRTREAVQNVRGRADKLAGDIFRKVSCPPRIFSPMRAAAAFTLNLCLAGSAMTGCYESTGNRPRDAAAESADVPAEDAREADAAPDDAGEPVACSPAEAEEIKERVVEAVTNLDPCLSMNIYSYGAESGMRVDQPPPFDESIMYCSEDVLDGARELLGDELGARDLACLQGHVVEIRGGDREDIDEMEDAIVASCSPDAWYSAVSLIIHVGSDGTVEGVEARSDRNPPDPEALECIRGALEGLVFPCLSGYEMCPEYVFVE